MFERKVIVGVAAAAVGALGIAGTAHAQAKAACTIAGKASTSGMGILSNTGVYTFAAGPGTTPLELACVVSQDADGLGAASQYDVQTVSVGSAGTFDNVVCGTGIATSGAAGNAVLGVARVTDSVLGDPLGNADLTGVWAGKAIAYRLDFVGGTGALRFVPPAGVTGGGSVRITDPTPQEFDTLTGMCTTDFWVNGAIAIVFDPTPV